MFVSKNFIINRHADVYNILFSAIVYLSLETHFKDDGRKCAPKIAIQGLLREKERKKKSVCVPMVSIQVQGNSSNV